MPTNLYGPGDNYDLQTSHIIPALLRKAHEVKTEGKNKLIIWGSGTPLREFLHVEDCADALVFLMKNYSAEQHINVGSGVEITIEDLAFLLMKIVGFSGALGKDASKPDGTPRKLMDNGRLAAMGWRPSIALEEGLSQTYAWYLGHCA